MRVQLDVMQRIGATDNADAIARHTNRLGYLCSAAKQKGIVVWIIGFGVDLDDAVPVVMLMLARIYTETPEL